MHFERGVSIPDSVANTNLQTDKVAEPSIDQLPEVPPRLWPGRPPGRPKHTKGDDPLVTFIREVYGPFFARSRNKLRAYIWGKDGKLYRAIQSYKRGNRQLPADIAMPSEREIAEERFNRAVKKGLGKLSRPERDTVRKRLWRHERQQPR